MTRPGIGFSFGVCAWVWLGSSCSPIVTRNDAIRDAGERHDDAGADAAGTGGMGSSTAGTSIESGSAGASGTGAMMSGGVAGKAAGLPAKCTAGESRCDGRKIADCSGGQWNSGSECPFVCTEGACTGTCVPDAKQCRGNVPQTCDATGEWMSGEACPNVCDKGECVGRCAPGSTQCSDKIAQVCNDAGAWVDDQTCPYVCEMGACTGVCPPNALQCAGNTPQMCDQHGRWVSGTSCPNICDAATGRCAGQCPPGMTGCVGTVPRKCNAQGAWEDGAIEENTCRAVCTPGKKQCVDTQEQVCNSTGTRWDNQPIRADVCGACAPRDTKCDRARRMNQVCNASGVWTDDRVTTACGASCNAGETGCAGNVSQGVPGECTASGGACWFGWTTDGVVFRRLCDATGNWTQQPCTGVCTISSSDPALNNMPAHFCATTGATSACVNAGTCPLQ